MIEIAHAESGVQFNPDMWHPFRKGKPRPTKSELRKQARKKLKDGPTSWEEHKAMMLKNRGR